MDNVVLGLSIAIAIVLVLLLTCWDKSPKKKGSKQQSRKPRPARKSEYGARNRAGKDRYEDLKDLAGYDDYNQVAQYMSVEPEVFESHSMYTADMNRSTSGPSMLSERDDPNDVVPWVGLRKPRYRDVYASGAARQEHSEHPSQMRENTSYCIG
jgi:hypothetical protein